MWFTDKSDEAGAHRGITEGTVPLSHEIIAAAASYEAAKAYERHVAQHGKPVNHEKAVALLAALTGGFIDRIVETKGLKALDRERLKHDAHKRAKEAMEQSGEY